MINNLSEKPAVMNEIPCAAAVFSYNGTEVRLSWANDRFFALFGCKKNEYYELYINDLGFRILSREYSEQLIDKAKALISNLSDFDMEIEAMTLDGSPLPLMAAVNAVRSGNSYTVNVLLRKYGGYTDNSMADMMFTVASISSDYIFRYDCKTDVMDVYRNTDGSFLSILKINDFEEFFKTGGYVYEEDEGTFEQICTNIKSGIDSGVFEIRLKFRESNEHKWYKLTTRTVRDVSDGTNTGCIGKLEDISSEKYLNQRLIEKAERDPLTGLYNKTATKQLIQTFLRTDSADKIDAFIIVDVDNFKHLNDTLGHMFGDSVLTDLAAELTDLFRSNDVIGRIGGDEFIVFLRGLSHISHIENKAADICKIFGLIYDGEDEGVTVSGSLGIALYPQDGDSFDELYKKADIALYTSKRAGKSCYTFYKEGDEGQKRDSEIPSSRIERYRTNMDFLGSAVTGSDILTSAFDMAESGRDISETINIILAKTAKKLHLGRVTVSELAFDERTFKDTYIYASPAAEHTRSDTIKFSKKELNDLCSCFDKNHILSVNTSETKKLRENAYTSYLSSNGISAASLCGYFRSGRLCGILSFQSLSPAYICSLDDAQALKDLTRTVFSYLIRLRDIDKARSDAYHAANYDTLTGLMNFRSFKSHVERYMQTVFDSDKFIFLLADFSNFSYINSRFGYKEGDALLKSFAYAVKYFSPNVKYVCRVAADRFCVFAEYAEGMTELFEDFIKRFVSNEMINGGGGGLGIISAAYINDLDSLFDFDRAYDNANLGLKYAKTHRNGKCLIYDPEMRVELTRTIEVSERAARGLMNSEFKVWFQPKISVSRNKIVGAEALVRWIKPDGSVVTPDSFVPYLEKNGDIVKIDFFVYEEVCKYIRGRLDKNKLTVPVSVNVSGIHMLTVDFVEQITSVVKRYKVDPALIELELSEAIFADNESDVFTTVKRLREFGFKVSIDDFCSGHSSLSLLKRLPVDILKIDRGFFDDVRVGKKEEIILTAVNTMAEDLGISVICEGIETEEQVEFLKNSKCDTVQGFYFAKPVPSSDLDELMDEEKPE